MLNPIELGQSAVQACVDALVDGQGGLLLYDHGLAGREALLAAGAQLAGTADLPLTVVDADVLRDQTTALLDRLGVPQHVFLPPRRLPTGRSASPRTAYWPSTPMSSSTLPCKNRCLPQPARRATQDTCSSHGDPTPSSSSTNTQHRPTNSSPTR